MFKNSYETKLVRSAVLSKRRELDKIIDGLEDENFNKFGDDAEDTTEIKGYKEDAKILKRVYKELGELEAKLYDEERQKEEDFGGLH